MVTAVSGRASNVKTEPNKTCDTWKWISCWIGRALGQQQPPPVLMTNRILVDWATLSHCWDCLLEWQGWTESWLSTSEEQQRSDDWETKSEGPDWDDMQRRNCEDLGRRMTKTELINRHGDGWHEKGRCRGQGGLEGDVSLWWPLKKVKSKEQEESVKLTSSLSSQTWDSCFQGYLRQ